MSVVLEPYRLSLNGVDLTYLEQGSGEPVVFVHGALSDYRGWTYQVEPFAADYQVLAYSQRHHYPNLCSGEPADYTTEAHAADLAALLSALDLAPAHIIGTSYGAVVALTMAAWHPELVRGLILTEPALFSWLTEDAGDQAMLEDVMATVIEPAQAAMGAGHFEDGVRLFIDGVLGRAGAFEGLPEVVRVRMRDNAPTLSSSIRETMQARFRPEHAERLTMPVLLLQGEHSPKPFVRILGRLEQHLPNRERIVIPAASHTMWSSHATATNGAALSFLSRL